MGSLKSSQLKITLGGRGAGAVRAAPGACLGCRNCPEVPPGRAGWFAGFIPGEWFEYPAVCRWIPGAGDSTWRCGTLHFPSSAEGKAVTLQVPGCKKPCSQPGGLLWCSHSREEGKKHQRTPEGEVFETDLKNVSLFWITFNTVSPGGGTSPLPGSEGRGVEQGRVHLPEQGWEPGEVSWGCQVPKAQGKPRT